MEKKMFFFPCQKCYAKLVNDVSEVGQERICSGCKEQLVIPHPPKRIPPFATIREVTYSVKTNKKNIVIVCPYCANNQKVNPEHCGKKIYCNCCKIIVEIPKYSGAVLKLKLSSDTAIADGKSVVRVTAETSDAQGIPIAGQKINFSVYRERGNISEVEETTNERGEAAIGYTTTIYSGNTTIRARLNDDKDCYKDIVLKEIDGIGDGKIVLKNLNFLPYETGCNKLKGQVVLYNPGKDTIIIEKATIVPTKDEYSDNIYFEPWQMDCKEELKEKSMYLMPVELLKKSSVETISFLRAKLEIVGVNRETKKKIIFQKSLLPSIETIETLKFEIASENSSLEEAGKPFLINIRAVRDGKIDKSVNEQFDLQFRTSATKSPNGTLPKIIEKESVLFKAGQGQISEPFCFFAQQEASIQVFYHKKCVGECLVVVTPEPIPLFSITLTSPQINNQVFTGNNTITLKDSFGNTFEYFEEPVFLSLLNGVMKKNDKIITQVVPKEGIIDLNAEELCVSIKNLKTSENELIVRYKESKQKEKWYIEPEPLSIVLDKIEFPVTDLQIGETYLSNIYFSKTGETDFNTESLLWKSYNQKEKCLSEGSIAIEDIVWEQDRLSFPFSVDASTPCDALKFHFFLGIENDFNQEKIKVDIVSSEFVITPKERVFNIQLDENITAGEPFFLQIETYCADKIDKNYCGLQSISIVSNADLPSKIDVAFIDGVAKTNKDFVVSTTGKYYLEIQDNNAVAIGKVEFEVVPGNFHHFEISMVEQHNHQVVVGENYLVAKDAFDNIILDFMQDVQVKGKNLTFGGDNFSGVLSGKDFVSGKLDITLSKMVIHKSSMEEKAEILFECGEIENSFCMVVIPQSGVVSLQQYANVEPILDPGASTPINIQLLNTGETILEVKGACVILKSQDNCENIPLEISPATIAAKTEYSLSSLFKIPEDICCGEAKVYIELSIEEQKTQKCIQYSFKKCVPITIEHAARKLKMLIPETVVAGEFFSMGFEVYKEELFEKEIDTSFHGKYDVSFSIQPHLSTQSAFPKKAKVTFEAGIGRTENLFGLFHCSEEYSCETNIHWVKDIQSNDIFPKVQPGKANNFELKLTSKQIANQDFNGKIIVAARDAYNNTQVKFAEKVLVTASGKGKLQRSQEPFIIQKQEFIDGVATIECKEIQYITEFTSSTEKIDIAARYDDIKGTLPVEITPAPAELIISAINVANEKVQWEENNYMLFLNVNHRGGAEIKVCSAEVEFFYDGQKQEGYNVIVQKKLPLVKNNETSNLSIIVGLDRDIPIGQHSIKVSLEYEDSYYKTKKVITKSHPGWFVEPCDRKIQCIPEKFHAWKPFSLHLVAMLDGKKDITYTGEHVLLCSCKNTQNLKTSYNIPRSVTLFFNEGECKTEPVFTFFEPTKNVGIEFYETEIGGATGQVSVDIHNELFSHALQRFLQKTLFFCKEHKRRLIVGCVTLLLLSMLVIHWRTVKQTQSLVVAKMEGTATIEGKPLKVGDVVFQYQNIVVAKDSLCILETKNGGTFKLYSSADVYIHSLGQGFTTTNYDNFVDVRKGDVSYQNKIQDADFPKIAIPDADNVDIKSREFRVGVKDDGSLLSIYEGKASLSAQGKTVEVSEGEGSSIKKGEAPSEPLKLPTAPVWKLPEENQKINSNSVSFEWYGVDGVNHYNLEVYSSELESVPLVSNDVHDNTQHNIKTLHDGSFEPQNLFSLIQSIDKTGFVSEASLPRRFIHHVESAKCELAIIATDKENNSPIDLADIWIDGQPYKNGIELEPKKYRLVIKKPGYEEYEEELELVKGEPFLSRKLQLKPKPRKMNWQIEADVFLENVEYDITKILINKEEVKSLPGTLLPGEYKLSLEATGFSLFTMDIKIVPAEEEKKASIHLKSLERNIVNEITTDIATTNPIVYMFDENTNITSLKPGTYRLQIECEGFVVVNKQVAITPGNEPFTIQEVLQAKEREATFTLQTNPWSVEQQVLKIIAIDQENIEHKFSLNQAQRIKPGAWKFQLDIEHYEKIEEKVMIEAKVEAYQYNFVAKAKPTNFNLELNSVNPLVDVTIVFNENKKELTLPYRPTMTVAPGMYKIKIIARGHHDEEANVVIAPGQKNYYKIELKVKKTPISSFVIDRANGIRDKIMMIIYQNERLKEPFLLPPGNLDLKIQLENYGEITSKLQIPITEEAYQVYSDLVEQERELSFNIAQFLNSENIQYQGQRFQIDNKSYNLVLTENNIRTINAPKVLHYSLLNYFTMKSSVRAQKVKIQVGYYIANYNLQKYQEMASIEFDEIDWQAFINHLNQIPFPPDKIKRLENTFRNLEKIKKPTKEEQEKLQEYILKLQTQTQRNFSALLKIIEAWK